MTTEFRNALATGGRIDRYEVEAVIGHGGFGISYRAVDIESGERVALKEFLPTELATREADDSVYPLSESHRENFQWGLERFLDEVRLVSGFRHRNIVRVHRAFEANGTAYMVMDYEEGESLATRLKREGTLASEVLTAMTLPLLDGLELVHEAGYIHRDIKPGNIYLRHDASPVLLDFGSARQALTGKSRTLTALVSAGYAPLEQYFSRSDLQGPWTDIYGLGATLYHAISGHPPIDAVERSRGVLGSTRDILPAAAEVATGSYPPAFLAAVDHALRMEGQDRPGSVGAWRKELTGEVSVPEAPATVLATPATRPPAVPVRGGGNHADNPPRNRAGLFGFVAVLALAVGSLLWWQSSRVIGTPVDRATESSSKATENRVDAQIATLRQSLSEVDSAEASSRKRIEELTAKLGELQAAQNSRIIENESQQSVTPKGRDPSEQQQALVAELRSALEVANTQSAEARQSADELDARLRILEAPQAPESGGIPSRRAEIAGLLAAAAEDIRRLRLTTPAGENAHERYRRVLELEQNNSEALLGLERIMEKYIALADAARGKGRLEKADNYLKRASTVLPAHPGLAAAQDTLAQTRSARDSPKAATVNERPDGQLTDVGESVELEAASTEDVAISAEKKIVNVSLPAQRDTPKADPRPLRVAVLPYARIGDFGTTAPREVSRFIRSALAADPDFQIVYYGSSGYDRSLIGKPDSLWQGSFTDVAPVNQRVYELAESVNADIVLMYAHKRRTSGLYSNDMYYVYTYIFDVHNRRRYAGRGHELNFKQIIHGLLANITRDGDDVTVTEDEVALFSPERRR